MWSADSGGPVSREDDRAVGRTDLRRWGAWAHRGIPPPRQGVAIPVVRPAAPIDLQTLRVLGQRDRSASGARADRRGFLVQMDFAAGIFMRAHDRGDILSRKGLSKPGEPPLGVSGKLARSIRARARTAGEGITVRASAFPALFLSLGAKGDGSGASEASSLVPAVSIGPRRMKQSDISKRRIPLPRPCLELALDRVIANGLADRMSVAVIGGLKFQRTGRRSWIGLIVCKGWGADITSRSRSGPLCADLGHPGGQALFPLADIAPHCAWRPDKVHLPSIRIIVF